MHASERAYYLIKKFEGLRLKTYLCPGGIHTIGYGHTGTDVIPGAQINEDTANAYLKMDIRRFENFINKNVTVPINQNQFDALVSFAFNIGNGNLQRSTLLKKLNDGNYSGAAEEFLRWNKASGKELPGLTKRRLEEKQLFEETDKKKA